MTQLFARLTIVASIPLLVAGCMRGTTLEEEQLASDGSEESAASAQSTNISNIVFSSLTSQDPMKAAGDVAGPPTALWPAGCVTRAKDASNPLVATVTFNDCTGPFGLVHLDGDVVATFSAGTNGALHVDLAGKNLSANNHPLTYSASADVTVSGATRNVTWHGAWTATNTRSQTVSHTSDLTIAVDTASGCRTASGTAKTNVETREIDTTIQDYKICTTQNAAMITVDGCPTGTVTHTAKLSGKHVSVTFDGSAQAEVTGINGRTFDVALVCTAAK